MLDIGSLGRKQGRKPVEKQGFRTVTRLLYWEGAFALAYETWVSPTYVSGLAGELGVSVGFLSLLMAAPWIGSMGQLLGAWAYDRVPSLKDYTLGVAIAARSMWLIPLLFAGYWSYRARTGGAAFPVGDWFAILAACACISALFATSSSAAWMSWMKGIIPGRYMGRFFGIRQRYTMLALIIANVSASLWVGWKPQGYLAGYALLGCLAILSAVLSTALLSVVPDAAAQLSAEPHASRAATPGALAGLVAGSLKKPFKEPFKDPKFRRVLVFCAAFQFAMQLAGPFFPYYFTKEAGLPMSVIAAWSALANLGCLVAAGYWGRKLDRARDASGILLLCALSMSLSPLFYVPSSQLWIRIIAPFDYFTNGIVSSGFALASTWFLFRSVPKGRNVTYFSVYTAAMGITGALGNFAGGQIAQALATLGGFRALWIVASALRLSTALLLIPSLREVAARAPKAGAEAEATA